MLMRTLNLIKRLLISLFTLSLCVQGKIDFPQLSSAQIIVQLRSRGHLYAQQATSNQQPMPHPWSPWQLCNASTKGRVGKRGQRTVVQMCSETATMASSSANLPDGMRSHFLLPPLLFGCVAFVLFLERSNVLFHLMVGRRRTGEQAGGADRGRKWVSVQCCVIPRARARGSQPLPSLRRGTQ